MAIHVRFIDLAQPLLVTGPSEATGITTPLQLSEAVAPLGGGIVGLHPCKFNVEGQVITGAVRSKHISIWNGEIKSLRSAVLDAEDLVFTNIVWKGSEPHSPGIPVPPIRAVRAIAPSTNCKVVYWFVPNAPQGKSIGAVPPLAAA